MKMTPSERAALDRWIERGPPEEPPLICLECGESYCEDEPPDEILVGYCSEACKRKGDAHVKR